jgi:hypothetical protein
LPGEHVQPVESDFENPNIAKPILIPRRFIGVDRSRQVSGNSLIVGDPQFYLHSFQDDLNDSDGGDRDDQVAKVVVVSWNGEI